MALQDIQWGLGASAGQSIGQGLAGLLNATGLTPKSQYQQKLADLMGHGDYAGASSAALGRGDTETGSWLARLQQEALQAQRSQANTDRAYDLNKLEFEANKDYRNSSLDLQRLGYTQGRVPPGYQPNPNGDGYMAVPGGPADPAVIGAQAGARGESKPPQVETFYDDAGREQKRQWNPATSAWDPVGGSKAAPQRPLPQNTVKALSDAGAAYADTNRVATTFDEKYGGQPIMGDLWNSYGRTFASEGSDTAKQAQWWQDYQSQKNVVRNTLFGSALTKSELPEFEKADINPGMSPSAIKANLARQEGIKLRAARKLADFYTKAGYPEDQIEAAIGVPLAELRDAPDPLSTKDAGRIKQGTPQQRAVPDPTGSAIGTARPNGQSAQGALPEGQTATNRQTGEKLIYRGGQWVPAQ